jgi:hypothetical protein
VLPRLKYVDYFVFALGAFVLYWSSSFVLVAHNATAHFGADTWYYSELAKENIFGRIAESYYLERITRFHVLTVAMAAGWMKALGLLSSWITPLQGLKAMFALAGALGACTAVFAFNTFLPRREAILCALVYAVSLTAWYYSGIEESKIITVSLTTLYIAIYLSVRSAPTARGAVLLMMVLLLGCLNEMVFAFIIILPLTDTFAKAGRNLRQYRWIILHALAIPLALLLVEGIVFALLPIAKHPEGKSHFALFFHYFQQNKFSAAALYEFAVNWFCFNILAPSAGVDSKGYFQPVLSNYLSSPAAFGAIALFCVMIVTARLPRFRASILLPAGILAGFAAFSFIRGAFFFVFDPAEPLLFSAPTTLAHLMIVLVPFAASRFPAKQWALAAFAALVAVNNGMLVFYSTAIAQ